MRSLRCWLSGKTQLVLGHKPKVIQPGLHAEGQSTGRKKFGGATLSVYEVVNVAEIDVSYSCRMLLNLIIGLESWKATDSRAPRKRMSTGPGLTKKKPRLLRESWDGNTWWLAWTEYSGSSQFFQKSSTNVRQDKQEEPLISIGRSWVAFDTTTYLALCLRRHPKGRSTWRNKISSEVF